MGQYNFPPGYSMVQAVLRSYKLVKNPLKVMTESVDRFGDCYTVRAGFNQRFILTQNPHLVEHVLKKNHRNYYKSEIAADKLARFVGKGLLTSNGDYWLKQRRLIQPGFHIKKIEALYQIMESTVDEYLAEFPTGKGIDIYPLMNNLAFRIVINTLFNISVPIQTMQELAEIISDNQSYIIKDVRQPYTSWLRKLSGEDAKAIKQSLRGRQIIQEIVQDRINSDQQCNDLLDMLLDSRYEDTGEPMTLEQVVDEILILIIAGHETTANALAWTLYLLGSNHSALQELRATTANFNIQECVKSDLLNSVIQESMRLYPPAWVSDRMALDDDRFDSYSFSGGTVIALFFFGMHRDPKIWDDPLKFDITRFTKEKMNKDLQRAYYPFGAGPRLCIGSHFAMAEMAIFLNLFIQKFDFSHTGTVPTMVPLITLRPDKVMLDLKRR